MLAPRRGSALLLDHCARLARLTDREERSARERLEAVVGSDLVRLLLGSLCGDHRPPARVGLIR